MVFHFKTPICTGLIRRLILPVVQLAEILSHPLLWENVYQRSAILFLSLFRLFQFPVIVPISLKLLIATNTLPVLFVQLTFYYPRRFCGRQNCTVKVKLLGNHSTVYQKCQKNKMRPTLRVCASRNKFLIKNLLRLFPFRGRKNPKSH